jgi:two-component system sensor histidine kinase KdpD
MSVVMTRNVDGSEAGPALTKRQPSLRSRVAAPLFRAWRSVLGVRGRSTCAGPAPRWPDYLRALGLNMICSAIAWPLSRHFELVNLVMLYLLATVVSALRLGRGPSIMIAVLNMLAVDYLFVPPIFSLGVQDPRELFILFVMLIVALVIESLIARLRNHHDLANARENRTAVLYSMSRELAVSPDAKTMVAAAVRRICAEFNSAAVVLLADDQGGLNPVVTGLESCEPRPVDLNFARQVCERGERSVEKGQIYLPLQGKRRIKGVMIVSPKASRAAVPAEQLSILDAFAGQLALSLQRARMAELAEASKIAAERVLLRNTLLASISHDLRTPLSAIAGAGSLLAQPEYALSDDRRSTLGHLIERKARDMSQLLTNVLELVQMEFGSADLRAEWHSIEDLIGSAMRNCAARLAQWRVIIDLPELPLIRVEATLIVQILNNLLENATKYSPPGTTITISAAARAEDFLVVVEDDGPGLPPGDSERLFDKFHRGHAEGNIVGVGLGLAICRAAARLHRGDIRAMARAGGGARFEITLPVERLTLPVLAEVT